MDFIGVGSGVDAMAGMETGARAGRRDGRSSAEMRPLSVTQAVLHAADGSARIKVGATDVLVAVYGPIECPIAKQHAERAEVHVEYRRRTTTLLHGSAAAEGMEAVATRDLKEVVQECLLTALNPRRAVSVTVHILSDDGGVTAAAINAATLALIDAGLPMQSVPIAACVSVHNDTLVVDPNRAEELEAQAVLTFTFNGTGTIDDGYIAVTTEGDCGGEKLFAAVSGTAHDLAVKTLAFFKLSIESKQNQSRVW